MAAENNIPFIKMQGTGNDFVVIDNRNSAFSPDQLIMLTPQICNRKYGVGADGLLALQQAVLPETDFEMLYRNADGSDAGMCGNGSRCLALYASQLGMSKKLTFSVHDEIYSAHVRNSETVAITFPVSAKIQQIEIEQQPLWQVFTGTEHVVKEVSSQKLQHDDQLVSEGRSLRYHERFQPKGTNANFFCGVDEQSLKVQTYERGVENLTLACGTGAIAAALVWHHKQHLKTKHNTFRVTTKGGTLNVTFDFNPDNTTYRNIKLTGPAHFVFEGTFYV